MDKFNTRGKAVLDTDNLEVIKTKDGYYRFIDRDKHLLTTGFPTKENLLKYKDCMRLDTGTIKLMTQRYDEMIVCKP